jgi:hypothetical protein
MHETPLYNCETLNAISRKVIKSYDASLLFSPKPIPVEEIIESLGLIVEYQYLRKNDRVCGETVFDDAEVPIYDMDNKCYTTIIVRAGTILIDARLLKKGKEGRLRFTLAHELAHWVIHKKVFCGSFDCAALVKDENGKIEKISSEADRLIEKQADKLAVAILMPIALVKRAFYQLRGNYKDNDQIITKLATLFCVSKQAMLIRLEEHKLI